ncbi:hypothetical protein H340_27096 [Streptomyces mobaraensis NBRC 13819 = DSM 40847]|uniref:Uncharacterized protein n=1 Tax=Streptomyces mobaraensis (strain ATCC 29032 / DSM 40847 / JCM 4168 / NBRC 13819 / NCIMB 11159 / IPCR 16-22) TaxID=1223523 RepID=M2ZX67_STRM1|nr:hypothetical protein [Streptomyces mobaraensis]EME97318.1 hypothetical protein H340_27096 [Streptomyces mobaraensis NBRC 13819 = DSM 40847]
MIVLAGEDQNDCDIMAALIRAHRPDLCAAAKLVRINDPVRLRKKSGADLSAAVKALVGKARAKALQQKAQLLGFVVHEDLDGFTDPHYSKVRAAVSAELDRQCTSFHHTALALAAWESEGWLLLFPDAFPHVRPRWKVPPRLRGRDMGRVKEPKEELKGQLGSPRFRESDGPLVARAALEHGLIRAPEGENDSYMDFVEELRNW